jgi:phosphoribosylaminoimidazolecarboxamide formyltransferase/IMP cyclohydrolase
MISQWFAFADQGGMFPDMLALTAHRREELRYGENPHQKAALYVPAGPHTRGIAQAEQIQGKELSYNNYNDADAALELVAEFRGQGPACVIVKHANPCGVAIGGTLLEAYNEALACDPVSAFGGIVAVNRPLTGADAEAITAIFTEVVIAPDADEEAKAVFARKKNLRLLPYRQASGPESRRALAEVDRRRLPPPVTRQRRIGRDDLQLVTKRAPTEEELADCLFAWTVAKHVKSNAIVYAKGGATAGIGAGQ